MSCHSEKVLCPFCGAEMRLPVYVGWTHSPPPDKGGYNWHQCAECPNCGANAPEGYGRTLEEAKEAARAAAMRRYTPPIKPMTLEEATSTDEAVWYEYNGSTCTEKIDCVALPEAKTYTEICTLRRDGAWLVTTECYGRTWRCWERKPTYEERRAAEWETN